MDDDERMEAFREMERSKLAAYIEAERNRMERDAKWREEDLRRLAAEREQSTAERTEHYALQTRMHRAEIAARLLARIPYGVENAQEVALDEADAIIAACAEVER